MRRVASVFALGLMMAFLHRVTAREPLEARATLALGFLLVVAYISGSLAERVRIPRVTAYLLVGFAVGPPWLGLVRRDEVDALRLIGDVALALIALAAGSELTLETVRSGGRTLARSATAAMAGPFLAVSVVTLSVSPWFPLSVHQPLGAALSLALVLGTVAAVSTPVITMAVMHELDARGPVARSLLGVAIAQDIAAVLLFAVVLGVGKMFTRAGALSLGVAGSALLWLLASLAAGVILGFLLGRYLRVLQRDATLLLVAAAFVVAVVAWLAHLETILMALAAGFYLTNSAPAEGERVRRTLDGSAVPVAVVFFAVAGAGIKVGILADLWPWALLLVGLRVVSLRFGFQWAGRDPAVTPAFARAAPAGLISQGGIALGLAQLARRAFPAWGVSLEALLVAMIGVHEVVGPVFLRKALRAAGETVDPRALAASAPGGRRARARGRRP